MERRITNILSTIPAPTALAGVVTSNPDTTKLHYTGSDDVAGIYKPSLITAVDSPSWIYVHGVGGAPPAAYLALARVIGIYKNGAADYTLFLDRQFAGAAGSACSFVPAPITFSFQVDGGGNAKVCSGDKNSVLIAIVQGEGDNSAPYQRYVQRYKFKTPLFVDATGTDVLVSEEL